MRAFRGQGPVSPGAETRCLGDVRRWPSPEVSKYLRKQRLRVRNLNDQSALRLLHIVRHDNAAISPDLREAAYAVGANERQAILLVFLPAATPSVLTGVLLALPISVGETAPLLYTAGWSNYLWNGHLFHTPIAYLTYAIWTFINEPLASANALAYAAALLVTSFVLLLSIASRLILRTR